MTLVQNFPFFSIILSMAAAIVSFVLRGRGSRCVHLAMVTAVLAMSAATLGYTAATGESYTFMMGHYPAPWGNEIRVGPLESAMALCFSLLMLLSVLGGLAHIERDIPPSKVNLFYIQLDLMLSSLLALIYTNDLFTAYVFIEICTIAACGLIMARRIGRVYVSAVRYMVMSLVGSGLFLIGLSLLYAITGHLLMSPAKQALAALVGQKSSAVPLTVIFVLLTVSLGIKSGLYPFHTWIPDAYGYTTPAAAAVLSSLVCKGYILLLVKLMVRVLPAASPAAERITDVLFVLGVTGMIWGSVDAIRERDVRRMTAYSSVAQSGYIYMGLGLGTQWGMVAAMFHVISHGAMKALLFICTAGLTEVSGGRGDRMALRGAGYRHRIAGIGFAIGSMSMIGIPLLTGFVSKYTFAAAATGAAPRRMVAAWIALAVSTTLNAVYFMRTVLVLYTSVEPSQRRAKDYRPSRIENAATIGLILLNIALGVASPPVLETLSRGLAVFG